ncbi:MAG: MBL fold metallo-hydrolase [Dehalococcoidia bacterium SM23_28_2]|nr:MAG: MBL fold metallo-hydrolase [Dehalococcoidia bacterium SM23_28_2]
MGTVMDLAEKMWSGEVTTDEHHAWTPVGDIEEIAEGAIFYRSFANVTAFETEDGLVLVDTGAYFNQRQTFQSIRSWSKARLNTAVYTHGHVDHVFGVPPFAEEAGERGWPRPRVVGHEAVAARFQRYILTAGYNSIINTRQFGADALRSTRGSEMAPPLTIQWPTEYTYPDTTYTRSLALTVGGERFELYHDRGETDDHTWVWVPDRKVLCPGDLFIWVVPNAGNPQKVQRYPLEWARALRKMAALEAEVLSPGHGVIVVGRERVQQALTDTAEFLESLHDQTVALMNQGATLDTIVHTVRPPAHLEGRPYLQPVYDEPEFIVRNIWRLYGGWYDGTPSHLKPAPEGRQGAEIASLAGGVRPLVERARQLMADGQLAMASHLVDWAMAAEADNAEVHEVRAEVYSRRADESRATMTRGIFRAAAWDSRTALERQEVQD